MLTDAELRAEIADHNFQLGREHFSYDVLADHLGELIPA